MPEEKGYFGSSYSCTHHFGDRFISLAVASEPWRFTASYCLACMAYYAVETLFNLLVDHSSFKELKALIKLLFRICFLVTPIFFEEKHGFLYGVCSASIKLGF